MPDPEEVHPAYEVFRDLEGTMSKISFSAAEEIQAFMDNLDFESRPPSESKEIVKRALPDIMNPYVDHAQDVTREYYYQQRVEALSPALDDSADLPSRVNVIDPDGNIIATGVSVGPSTEDVIYDFDNLDVPAPTVPNKSWESAVGKAFQSADERVAAEGTAQAFGSISSSLISYSDRRLLNSSRDMILSNVEQDDFAVGWQRLAYPGACAFCRMLAGRGGVYKTEASASFVVGRGKVRKVRGRPVKRGRKVRKWEQPERRQVRELSTTYHDHCHCKVIPRWTFNGAELPLPQSVINLEQRYRHEYYAAVDVLNTPKNVKKATNRFVRLIDGIDHLLDPPRLDKPRQARPILRIMRKNDMSVRARRFAPLQSINHDIDTAAASWAGSPYLAPQPFTLSGFWDDYKAQFIQGAKEEGGIYARRKGNQFAGRLINKEATRVQRRIDRKISNLENVPTWQKVSLRVVNSEVRRKSTRFLRYNTKQGLKSLTGQTPTWNLDGLFQREWDETVSFHQGQFRRRANRVIRSTEKDVKRHIDKGVRWVYSEEKDVIDWIDDRLPWWGSAVITPRLTKSHKRRVRRVSRKINRPFRRRATRLKKMIAKKD